MAYYWYKTAADQGHDCGQYNVGFMWHNGHGVQKNPKVAVEWYKKAADQGYLSAQRLLANIYFKGEDKIIPMDHLQATHYYLLLSEKDDENARKFLTNSSYTGIVNTYLSQNWEAFFPKFKTDTKNAIYEIILVLKEVETMMDVKVPVELWWLVCEEVVHVWPTAAYFLTEKR
eukprot:TRINITY_DN3351_c0_g1_i1.p1 TRINITY_DN3351_c0_g1~~TRINITY_DN3351_c0_g1_i1.p1  ORF type:complete len:173 (-),score=34.42 TRINITY_DN3351_c0_g1_i1:260-778(-)